MVQGSGLGWPGPEEPDDPPPGGDAAPRPGEGLGWPLSAERAGVPTADEAGSTGADDVQHLEPDDLRHAPAMPPAAHAALGVVSRETFGPELPADSEPTRVIVVSNQKGGVGKTTSVVNLAAALAQQGKRCLVVDMDPQGNASTALGVGRSDRPSIYDVLLDGRPLAEAVVAIPEVDGLLCVPSTIDLAGAEVELVTAMRREHRLDDALHAYLRDCEAASRPHYVFVDCPPSLGLLTLSALVAADEVLVPIQCEYYALEGLGQLLGTVEKVRELLNPSLAVSTILLTMFDGRTRLSAQVAEDVRAHFGGAVLPGAVPRSVRISEAPSFGQTVMTYDPRSRGAMAYRQAAATLDARGTIDSTDEASLAGSRTPDNDDELEMVS